MTDIPGFVPIVTAPPQTGWTTCAPSGMSSPAIIMCIALIKSGAKNIISASANSIHEVLGLGSEEKKDKDVHLKFPEPPLALPLSVSLLLHHPGMTHRAGVEPVPLV